MPQNIAETLATLLRERGWTRDTLVQKVPGISEGHLYRILRGKKPNPTIDTLRQLAEAFGIHPAALIMGGDVTTTEIADLTPVPAYGRVRAGAPTASYQDIEGTLLVPYTDLAKGELFAVRVRGDSMETAIHDDDLLICRRSQTAADGDIVVATCDGENTVKRFFHDGRHVILRPENPAYTPIVVDGEHDCRLVGVALIIHHLLPHRIPDAPPSPRHPARKAPR